LIDDETWLRAVRMVSRPGSPGAFDVKVDDRLRYNPRHGWKRTGSHPILPNPQLQVLGDWTRRNPVETSPPASRETLNAVRKFHGAASGELLTEYGVNDDGDDEIELGYLGHVPAISFLSKKVGSAPKQIDVNGELVRFSGFRVLFRGQSRPVLALHIPTNEAVIVQGTVESMRDRCDDSGVLGYAPVVEYIVEEHDGSTKGDFHYVHEFDKDAEPVLRWADNINGLVYDRDRSLVATRRKNAGKKKAVYEVTDWFHEASRRHGER
jgi:hypothetical protein